MSQASELLDNLTDEQIEQYAVDQAVEEHIVIGADRFITVPERLKRLAVQFDHNIETVTFDCPRFWDEHDLSKMKIYINYMRPDKYSDMDLAENVVVDETDDSIMHFTWTITGNVTPVKGNLSFLVCIKKTDADGIEENHWNSELCRDCYISEGMECEQSILDGYPDIITDLLLRMDVTEAKTTEAAMIGYLREYLTEGKEMTQMVKDFVTEYLSSDSEMNDVLDEYVEQYIGTIEKTTDRELLGSVEGGLKINRILGKSEQVQTSGKNLLPITAISYTINGVTFTVNEDGSISINGTATGNVYYNILGSDHDYTIEKLVLEKEYVCLFGSYTNVGCRLTDGSYIGLSNNQAVGKSIGRVYLTVNSGDTIDTVFYPMICYTPVSDDTYEPYTGGIPGPNPEYPIPIESASGNAELNVRSKNLLRNTIGTYTVEGITYEERSDGSITINGTATGVSRYTMDFGNEIPYYERDLIASLEGGNGNVKMAIGFWYVNGTAKDTLTLVSQNEQTFQYPSEAYQTRTYLVVAQGTTISNLTVYPMIRLAEVDSSEFDKFREKSVSLSVPSANMRSIKARFNHQANYVDKDGTYWITDEIDVERGAYIQRIATKVIDGSEGAYVGTHANGQPYHTHGLPDAMVNTPVMSNRYRSTAWTNENGFVYVANNTLVLTDSRFTSADACLAVLQAEKPEVMYALAQPIETPIDISKYIELNSFTTHKDATLIVPNDDLLTTEVQYGISAVGGLALKNSNRIAVESIQLDNHNHDDRYYTEAEIDTKIDNIMPYKGTIGDEFNIDETLTHGMYWCVISAATTGDVPIDVPVNGNRYGVLEVIKPGGKASGPGAQRFTSYTNNHVYVRMYVNSVWGAWVDLNYVATLADLGITASATELNYMKGVTSGVQGQLDANESRADRFFPDSAMHSLVTDCLQINTAEDWTSNSGNRDSVIATEDVSTIVNSPISSGAFYAYREIRQVECAGRKPKAIVTLKEAYPIGGREWSRAYNPDTGHWDEQWNCHDGACSHRDLGKSITDIVTNGTVYVCTPDHSKTMPICASEFTTGDGHKLTSKANQTDLDGINPFKGVFNSGNIDELMTYGIYWVKLNQNSTTITGTIPPYVNTQFGYFEVLKAYKEGTDCMQRFTEYFGGVVHTRVYVNGGWIGWKTYNLNDYLPLSGGTLTGTLKVQNGSNGAVVLRSDGEGGNINIHSPSSYNSYWEIDAHNGDLRLYRNNGGTLECFNTFPITDGTLLNTSSVGDAAYKGVTDSTSTGGNIGTGTALTTERDVYNGLPTINGSHTYSANTNIYAPNSVGESGAILRSNGSGAPSWIKPTDFIFTAVQGVSVSLEQYGEYNQSFAATTYSGYKPIAAFLHDMPSGKMNCWKCCLVDTDIHLGIVCPHEGASGTVSITVIYLRV